MNQNLMFTRNVFSIARMHTLFLWSFFIGFAIDIANVGGYDTPQLSILNLTVILIFIYTTIRLSKLLNCWKIFILCLLGGPIIGAILLISGLLSIVPLNFDRALSSSSEPLAIIGTINFVQILYLHWKATRELNQYGIRIGLFGAKSADLFEFARANR